MTSAEPSAIDWSATALAEPAGWPTGLLAVVRMVLAAPLPMALAVGPDAVLVYNDAYAEVLGSKHPGAFGRPAAEVLRENWHLPGHGDVVERVYRTGVPFFEPDTVLPVRRHGAAAPAEHVHFSRAYTAVRGDDGAILGVLSIISETTEVIRALSGVADLTARLSPAVSVDDVAREALRFAVERLGADHARIVLADGPALRMARRARADGTDDAVERLPPVWARLRRDAVLPSATVTRTGRPLWLDDDRIQEFGDLRGEPLSPQRLHRIAAVPLHTGTVRGAMALGWEGHGEISDPERSALTAVGNLVAQSLARAQRFDEQRGLAESLQLSMLPTSLPQMHGLGLAGRYAPSGPGAAAGGDFYDAFELDDGRLVLAIGDVVGHGVQAATVMGQVRAAVRVLALRDGDPAGVLAGLDPYVASLGAEAFVTMIVAVLDPAHRTLDWACAGHPPPVLCRRGLDGRVTATLLTGVVGAPVGIGGEHVPSRVTLRTDDVLVLYTDGLVEVPGEDPDTGLRALAAAAADAAETTDPRRVCSTLLERRRTNADDAALLVLAVHEGQRQVAATDLPADATSPREARAWTRRVLRGWALDDGLVDDALLGVSELVSNALLHARTGARVELDLDEQRLLVLVSDGGTHAEPSPQPADPTASRGRGLGVIASLAAVWGSEQSSRGTTVWFELVRRPAPRSLALRD